MFRAMQKIKMISFVVGMLVAGSAMASPYYVDSMICVGQIKGNHSQVHPSYNFIVTKFTSFLSKRKDGTWVPSLRVANDYAEKKSGLLKDPGGEVWFMNNLTQSGDRVTHSNGEYNLTITNIRGSTQTLVGRYKTTYSVAGNGYWYDYNCTAQVVNYPTRKSDLTAKR